MRDAETDVIDRRGLLRALGDRPLADWVLIEHDEQLAAVDEAAPGSERGEQRQRWDLTVHIDAARGRGSARLELQTGSGLADNIVDQAIALANASVGPAWSTSPPAAPAKVALLDPALARAELGEVAKVMLHDLKRPPGAAVVAAATVSREHVLVITKQGALAQWVASLAHADATIAVGDRSLEVSRDARRVADLGFGPALAAAAADLALYPAADAVTPGPCTVVLTADAMLHGGLGIWQVFANQADAVVARQGLARYRPGSPIAEGARAPSDPLTIVSDGALDFAVGSAPIGDDGDAVRRFTLIDRGIAVGLGLSPREAALRGEDPNGGVRNLVVAAGAWQDTPASLPGRVVEVRRLRSLAIDPYTGDATLEIALGLDLAGGKAFTGGSIRLDLVASLARARRSGQVIRRGSYQGPSAVVIDGATLLA